MLATIPIGQNILSSCLLYKILRLNIILSVVLYGCETWSDIVRKRHRLRVSENRVLRRIFGDKREGEEKNA
jgi:predicted PP-loop superfamily ATPase